MIKAGGSSSWCQAQQKTFKGALSQARLIYPTPAGAAGPQCGATGDLGLQDESSQSDISTGSYGTKKHPPTPFKFSLAAL